MENLTRTKVKELLASPAGKQVMAKGWVRTKRGNKQIKFIALTEDQQDAIKKAVPQNISEAEPKDVAKK